MQQKYWQLIVKRLTAALSEDEERQLQEWLDASPENREMLETAQQVLENADRSLTDYEPDTEAKWKELKARIEAKGTDGEVRSMWTRKWWQIAAAVILLAGIGYIIKTASERSGIDDELIAEVKMIEVITTDSLTEVWLPDSTHLWLNVNSKLVYPEQFAKDQRRVELSGEGYFEVEADSLQPFIVSAGNTETRVLGTSFSVSAYDNEAEIEVAVDEGVVEFSTKGNGKAEKLKIKEGYKGNYNRKSKTVYKQKHKKGSRKFWKQLERDIEKLIKDAGKLLKGKKKR